MTGAVVVGMLLLHAAPVDDFDFGVDMDPDATDAEPTSPVSGWMRPLCSRQVDGTPRWIDLGVGAGLRLDLAGVAGQLVADASLRVNAAYRLEEDSDSLWRRYELEPWLRELFWRRAFGPLTLTLGNLVTTWGVADMLSIVDRLSVIDHGRAFFEDPEEIYAGQWTAAVSLYLQSQRLTIAVVPYPRFDRVLDGDHPYSMTPGERLGRPRHHWGPEVAVHYQLSEEWGSVALLGGYVRNREPIVRGELVTPGDLSLQREHAHYEYLGCTATAPVAPLLLKVEVTYDYERPAQTAARHLSAPMQRVSQVSAVLGADLNLGAWGTLIAEALGQSPLWPDQRLALRRPATRVALAWRASFCGDSLDLTAVIIWLESPQNAITRAEIAYDINGQMRIGAKGTLFFINNHRRRYGALDALDRVDLLAEYGF